MHETKKIIAIPFCNDRHVKFPAKSNLNGMSVILARENTFSRRCRAVLWWTKAARLLSAEEAPTTSQTQRSTMSALAKFANPMFYQQAFAGAKVRAHAFYHPLMRNNRWVSMDDDATMVACFTSALGWEHNNVLTSRALVLFRTARIWVGLVDFRLVSYRCPHFLVVVIFIALLLSGIQCLRSPSSCILAHTTPELVSITFLEEN